MRERDFAIIRTIETLKVASRDDIVNIFFSDHKSAISNANSILKRLVDRRFLRQSKVFQPNVYLPYESNIKDSSRKIMHYLEINKVFTTFQPYISFFETEPCLGPKGVVEPDNVMILNGTPFFLEMQLTNYDQKKMNDKFARYEAYYQSKAWYDFEWQKPERKVFPYVLLVSARKYQIPTNISFKIIQVSSLEQFENSFLLQANC